MPRQKKEAKKGKRGREKASMHAQNRQKYTYN